MLGPLLQYQSLKTVLLHTDANTRFRISTHMPSIREVENKIPLRISGLDMSDNYRTVVNNTSYQVGIIRYIPDGDASMQVKQDQEGFVSDSDFDELGFPFDAGRNVVLPGDVSFKLENRPEFRMDTEREYRTQLRIHEEAFKKQAELETKGITVEDYLKSFGPIDPRTTFEGGFGMRQFLKYTPHLLSGYIQYFKLALLPFDCRRNNTKPPFTCYVQLTITKGGSSQIQRFEYNKKLFEASKSLHKALFGSRTLPIQVGRLDLNRDETIYRLPTGFRVHAIHVRTSHDTLAHLSFPSLVENSESLESIEMTHGVRGDAFQTEIVRRAKRLVIIDAAYYVMTQAIQHLPNLEITLNNRWCSPEETFILIQAWLSADRPVGALCCLEVKDEEIAESILRSVQTQYERTNRTKRCVTIQKTDSTRVELFYVPYTPRREYSNKGILNIRIVKI